MVDICTAVYAFERCFFIRPAGPGFTGLWRDSQFLDKGRTFQELPGLQIYYVSDKDIWKAFQTVYPVRKYLGDEGLAYDDGSSVTYVNTEVDDGRRSRR